METLFDHEPTREELQDLLPTVLPKKEYLALPIDADSENGRIFRLYMMRGDSATAHKYLRKIQDEEYKLNLGMVDTLIPQ